MPDKSLHAINLKGFFFRIKIFVHLTQLFLLNSYPFQALFNQNPVAFDRAVALYDSGHFNEAAQIFDSLLSMDKGNPYLLYNLGNCAFKQGKIGEAVRYFADATRRKPYNRDFQKNLEFVLSRTQDELPQQQEPFIIIKWLGLTGALLPQMVWIIIISFFGIISFSGMALFTFSKLIHIRKLGFRIGMAAWILGLIFIFPPWIHQLQLNQRMAVVTASVCDISSEPSESAPKLFVLHEGALTTVKDSTSSYYFIQIDHIRKGWAPASKIVVF